MSRILTTSRLVLRDFCPEDADAYVRFCQHAKYQRFYSEKDCSEAHQRALVELFVRQAKEMPRSAYQFAIEDRQSGQLIGTCGLRLESDRQASVGCGVSPGAQGTGLAAEAMAAMVRFGFEQLDVHRVYAETIANNHAAIRLCRQFGMKKEAHFTDHRYFKARWWDTVVYAIRRQEWQLLLAEDERLKAIIAVE